MKLKVITKDGELSAMFLDSQINIAKQYAEMHNGKVIEIETGKILYDACKSKHYKEIKNVNQKY